MNPKLGREPGSKLQFPQSMSLHPSDVVSLMLLCEMTLSGHVLISEIQDSTILPLWHPGKNQPQWIFKKVKHVQDATHNPLEMVHSLRIGCRSFFNQLLDDFRQGFPPKIVTLLKCHRKVLTPRVFRHTSKLSFQIIICSNLFIKNSSTPLPRIFSSCGLFCLMRWILSSSKAK